MGAGEALDAVLAVWRERYGLTRAETTVLRLVCEGWHSHAEVAVQRAVKRSTVKKQVHHLLEKVKDATGGERATLARVACMVLRNALVKATASDGAGVARVVGPNGT